jgi:D-alanine-D-alanine ligase
MTHVLLVFGGEGSEHDVSVMSARNVVEALRDANYEVTLAYIDRTGNWLAVKDVDNRDNQSGETISLNQIDVDVIFPLIHGKGGEDGMIAYMGKTGGIPVVGCGPEASMIAWDKDRCKQVLSEHGLPVVPWITLREGDALSYDSASKKLESEILFVKPAREGSSIGVSRATNEQEFIEACEQAFRYDDKILIEKAISGRELECAVLGNSPDTRVTEVGEITTTDGFYDYDSKYVSTTASKLDIPAQNLSPEQTKTIQDYAKRAFDAIGGAGLSRVDFFLDASDVIYINEINTMPGFTNISMYPKLWQQAGLSYGELVSELVRLAL